MRFFTRASRFLYWLLAGGIVAAFVVALVGSRETVQARMLSALAFTLGPAFVGWFGLTGLSALWSLALGWRRVQEKGRWDGFVSASFPLIAGVACLSLAVWLLFHIVKYAFAV
jgi:hypothetical protein